MYINVTDAFVDETISIKLPHFNNNISDVMRTKKFIFIKNYRVSRRLFENLLLR